MKAHLLINEYDNGFYFSLVKDDMNMMCMGPFANEEEAEDLAYDYADEFGWEIE